MQSKYLFAAILVVTLGSLFAQKAITENTAHLIGSDSTGSKYYIYTNLIEESGVVREYWVMSDARNDNAVKYRTMKVFRRVNCNSRRMMTISYISYLPNGDILDEFYQPNSFMKPIVPNTVGELEMNYVCELD